MTKEEAKYWEVDSFELWLFTIWVLRMWGGKI